MKDLALKISETVEDFARALLATGDADFYSKKQPDKWSKAEIVGHLVDSAQNNIQRFIRGQYETSAPEILYAQNDWVRLGHYQKYPKSELVHLWVTINKHLSHVLSTMSEENYYKKCVTGSGEEQTLRFFAEDYLVHLNHHLEQIKNN